MRLTINAFLILLLAANCFARTDSIWKKKPTIEITGLVDIFYAFDFNRPKTSYRQTFFYNHNRHNEPNLNLGIIKLSIQHPKYRANFALQAGTYVMDNYASEPKVFKHIFEANAGFSINKKNNLWLDAGILPSHIGFESAISFDNQTLTRSILAENSPYYLTGAKLTFYPNRKWEVAALIFNGWQHIQNVKGNSLPSFGTQLKFSPQENIILNWSTFIGTDDPDSIRRLRFFNNFYGQLQLTKKLQLITGFDVGFQQKSKGSSQFNYWLSPVIILHYDFTSQLAAALRAEYYQDLDGTIIVIKTNTTFKTAGLSLNIDYKPLSIMLFRLEGRWLINENPIFENRNRITNNNLFITFSMCLKINRYVME